MLEISFLVYAAAPTHAHLRTNSRGKQMRHWSGSPALAPPALDAVELRSSSNHFQGQGSPTKLVINQSALFAARSDSLAPVWQGWP